jgi:hypothetical protein
MKTPINIMMSWYKESEGGGTCEDDFGNKLIDRWRNTKSTFCSSSSSYNNNNNNNIDNIESSSIECYLIQQNNHAGNGDNICKMKNISVNFGLFGDDSKTRTVVQHYVQTRHEQQPYIEFPKGFITGKCVPDSKKWIPQYMPGWNKDWTVN